MAKTYLLEIVNLTQTEDGIDYEWVADKLRHIADQVEETFIAGSGRIDFEWDLYEAETGSEGV